MRQPLRPRLLAAAGGGPAPVTGFGSGAPAGIAYGDDVTNVSVGTAFEVLADGLSVTKVRVYLAAGAGAPTSGLVGALCTSGGSLLTSAAFGATTPGGWNEVAITAQAVAQGVFYYPVVFFPAGGYSFVAGQFTAAVTASPIRFPATATIPNGKWLYGAALAFPANDGAGTWYGVDVEVA